MATATHPTTKKSSSKKTSTKTAASKSSAKTPSAIKLLKDDHREVEDLFSQYQKARSDARKTELVRKICLALKVHTQIEEEYFYPASREFVKSEDIVDEAIVEHASAKELIAQLEAGEVGDELYDAKVTVLCEMIEHHVEEEEKEYFPQVQKSDMDLEAIGTRMAERKKELMAQLGGEAKH
ncbi:MAG: hemerythrin domain-containing protein [Phenylobacterium sp.]|uniref:hemerythrin domain-containing protein n=1 Tax=Phenylobacterium sp. TaxID=1871053 RepID=UPI00391875A4